MTELSGISRSAQAFDRRGLLRGLGAAAASSMVGGAGRAKLPAEAAALTGLLVAQLRAPLCHDGACPWHATVQLGTPQAGAAPQTLKMVLDTGSNFIWSRATLGGASEGAEAWRVYDAFDSRQSASFARTVGPRTPLGFGAWGTMMAEHGRDLLGFPNSPTIPTHFYLGANHAGRQLRELAWDGGIGFPSGSDHVQPGISFVLADLMDAGIVDRRFPQVAFDWNAKAGTGTCQIGGTDANAYVADEGIVMPWKGYTEYPGVQHLWTTELADYTIGSYSAGRLMFGLDSGASHFRGEAAIMRSTLDFVQAARLPVRLTLGTHVGRPRPGTIVIPPSVYDARIEAGTRRGETIAQFAPANLANLVLAGSVLMEQLYTVFEYTASMTAAGVHLAPKAMYLYNKKNGPKLIQPGSALS